MYHFVGIKGSGMSSLAQIMHELGYEVKGSDVPKHFFTEDGLRERNIEITDYSADNIKEGMMIIRGASIKDDNPEIIKAEELHLPIYWYNEFLGIMTEKFKSICIAGCHGKTTTTSMMALVLNELKGANYLIGDGTGYAKEGNEFFILESCEYKRHFLSYTPYYSIITNIDLDHVDYYKDIDDVIDAYKDFANKTNKIIIACGDDRYTHTLEVNPPIFYYGLDEDNDIRAFNVNYKETGTSFEVEVEGNYYGFFDLPIYGKHMLLDALAVIAICYYERLDAKDVNRVFKEFKGAKRRFSETIVGDSIIIDDYAHHPNEVKSTLKAVKQKYPDKKVVSIFQPHTFTRTKEFADDIAEVLNTTDKAFVMDIHPAREKQEDYEGVTSDLIIKNLKSGGHINIDEAEKLYEEKDAVYVFMSPNDISSLENDLQKLLEENLSK